MNSKSNLTRTSWKHFNMLMAALALASTWLTHAQVPQIDPTFSDANWVSLGSGMEDVLDDTCVAALLVSGTNLYAGGHFTTAGGVSANNIAKWNGSAWSALGSGIGGYYPIVQALAVSGTNLYVGGNFTTAGGVPAMGIAKWDGSAWSALGSDMGGSYPYVRALAVNVTNLYAGGELVTAGGVQVNGIAKWDGNSWSPLGSGVSTYGGGGIGYVYALALSGTNLYAGGLFTTAGGAPASYIARWDGSAWSTMGWGWTARSARCCWTGQASTSEGLSPRQAGYRPATSPNGMAPPGRPWAQG
jgi:hypothetical protein